ncbi:hypothetical protein AB0H18_32910 [Streptomyces sp. NPDC020766]|uniref:hypothetical protein n=1 Tax=Streptomyces sp. NPDC020766 TaxID=3155011 RepID=UPI0033DB2C71
MTTDSGLNVLDIGTANLIERELRGLRPDVAVVAVPYAGATYRYLERLLEALGGPPLVVPTLLTGKGKTQSSTARRDARPTRRSRADRRLPPLTHFSRTV